MFELPFSQLSMQFSLMAASFGSSTGSRRTPLSSKTQRSDSIGLPANVDHEALTVSRSRLSQCVIMLPLLPPTPHRPLPTGTISRDMLSRRHQTTQSQHYMPLPTHEPEQPDAALLAAAAAPPSGDAPCLSANIARRLAQLNCHCEMQLLIGCSLVMIVSFKHAYSSFRRCAGQPAWHYKAASGWAQTCCETTELK